MKRIRKSKLVRMMCFFMSFSFLLISCDPNNDLANDYKLDKAIEEQMAMIETQFSGEDCEEAKQTLNKVKAYILSRSQPGLVGRAEVLNFLIDDAIATGEIEGISQEERDLIVSTFEDTSHFLNDNDSLDPVYEKMKSDEAISENEMDFLINLEDIILEAADENEVIGIFNQIKIDLAEDETLSSNFKTALFSGFDQAELALCASLIEDDSQLTSTNTGSDINIGDDGNQASERCEILQCVTEHKWKLAVVNVLITVVAIILAIFTFGFTLILVLVTMVTWVLVTFIVCALIPCPPGDCPEGQFLTCLPGFTLNGDNLCFASGFKFVGDAIFSDPPPGTTDCPPGSVYQGSFLGCFHGLVDGIFGDLVEREDYWADTDGAYHKPVCN